MEIRNRARVLLPPAAALGVVLGKASPAASAQSGAAAGEAGAYDLVIQGGHVIDPKNNVNAVRDIAVKDGKIAEVARRIDASAAKQTVDARGQYVTPGLIDLHAHLFYGPENDYANGKNGVVPDGFTFRSGVTTAVDAGSSGAANFELFKKNIIDRAQTRVLAFLNIVGKGMGGAKIEQDVGDMLPGPAVDQAERYPGTIVGIKTAHYEGNDWIAVDRSVEAGVRADLPVKVDFGSDHPERPLEQLLTEKLGPGDIYTHAYSGLRRELGEDGRLNPGMHAGRRRGVLFDVGHGGGSFSWAVVKQAMKEGFPPDTLSTDLHITSMNSGMKDMANLMSKFLVLGMSLQDVIKASTWMPARTIGRPDLGHLSEGAPADIVVLSADQGAFGFTDSFGYRIDGKRRLTAQVTVRAGKVVWDLNGVAAKAWSPETAERPVAGMHAHC
ncbi:amidohydrolase/deacetylase family metallohydrolase [Streptomyces sp. A7024]|uniref:Amidohydrolase/deacetylase family metallohydrolase n=1 Tax=Streptomyces coryli TaxID=1128680 RepID=A0A6G4UAD7_9ACTN|nr:amidohydrolase/deacetylase family metallohydrolase [Streptomyces coryli]NGN68656.1 amidohydrolase/deacetylase family metallohydrolase [Streptomyces coryli]